MLSQLDVDDKFLGLTPTHQEALRWFAGHANKEVDWPAPLGGMYLVNKAKGIQKPAGIDYALSVRHSLAGPYHDVVHQQPDGPWRIEYAQEGDDPNLYTNFGLRCCMRDGVPIGVIFQVSSKPKARYRILGLGKVIGWSSGIFEIQEYS